MLELKITITGRAQDDLELAVEEVLKKIKETYLAGHDKNYSGSYRFDTTGEPETPEMCSWCNKDIKEEPERDGDLVFCNDDCHINYHDHEDENISECQNCTLRWYESQLVNPIPDLHQRVAPGEPMPSGECPECGALCQPIDAVEASE